MEVLKQPVIEFYDGVAVIHEITIKNPDSIALLKRMKETEVESLIDSMLSTIAKVGEGLPPLSSCLKSSENTCIEPQERNLKVSEESCARI